MQFEIGHEFDIPRGALELAVISPDLCTKLARKLPNVESVAQREHALRGRRLERVWSYRANVKVPAFARSYVRPEMMAWDERSAYDIDEHAGEWTIIPHVKADWRRYFAASGSYSLSALERGRTRRLIRGALDLRVPVVRSVAEKLIVAEVRRMFDAEAETLRDLATRM